MAKQSQSDIDTMIQRVRTRSRDLVRRDILQAIQSSTSSLILKISPFYYNDGSTRELLCLSGTVNCQYKGNRYNIPVEIWLQEDHPHQAPVAYVKPTLDMYVSPQSRDVEPDGRIVLSYIKSWRHPTSDLANLLQSMSDAFSHSPPVYSNASRSTPYPAQNVSMPMPYGYPQGSAGCPPSSTGYLSGSAGYPPTSAGYPPSSTGYSQSYPQGYPQQQIPHDIYRDSLISAVLDKVKYSVGEQSMISKAEIDSLKRTEEDLIEGGRRLEAMLNECQQQEIQAQNYIAQLKVKMNQMKEANGKMSSSQTQQALKDDVLSTPAPVYKQLLQAYCEEHAIQDLLYFLGDGHRRRAIELDIYLKHVRELSRRQFILRATMHKCRQVAGLPIK